MELPKRKQTRLADYSYSTPGAYFITVCTIDRQNLFWAQVGADIIRPEGIPLNALGKLAEQAIQSISQHYSALSVDCYVIMPNHIHLLLQIHTDHDGRILSAPTISRVVGQFKRRVSKQAGFPLWQKGFYDHVIRGEQDYIEVWQYIRDNPVKWEEDHLYRK